MRYSIFSNSQGSLLDIKSIGYAKNMDVTRFGPGVRNYYIIHYVLSGKGYFNGNCVKAGQGFLITPGMNEHYYPDPNDPWEFLWIISDDSKIASLFPLFHANQETLIFQFDYLFEIKDMAYFLCQNRNAQYNAFEMLEFFLKVFKYQAQECLHDKVKTNAELYIEAAENYIMFNMHRALSVEELTSFLGVSQPYLFKIFKEHLLTSPKQYILHKKISHAQHLLKSTELSITYIANSVGFTDVLSFSKCFCSKVGVSPKNYRMRS